MSTDVDDVVALCIAHRLQTEGHAKIVAVVHNTGLDSGVGAIAVINHHYGRNHIPLGAYKGNFDNPSNTSDPWVANYAAGPYVQKLVEGSHARVKTSSDVPDAVDVYRKVLSEQPDHSVVIASIGFLSNLAAVLQSKPDKHSRHWGNELVRRKVRELVVMGGRYPTSRPMHYEWNFGGGCAWGSQRCADSPVWSRFVVENWPKAVPLTFSGFEVGGDVMTGGRIRKCAHELNPCRRALELFHGGDGPPSRPSWDPVTVLYAARGVGGWLSRHQGGVNQVDEDGANEWQDGVTDGSHQSYLVLAESSRKEIAEEVDRLLCGEHLKPARTLL